MQGRGVPSKSRRLRPAAGIAILFADRRRLKASGRKPISLWKNTAEHAEIRRFLKLDIYVFNWVAECDIVPSNAQPSEISDGARSVPAVRTPAIPSCFAEVTPCVSRFLGSSHRHRSLLRRS
jgi:hypothetical protein